MKRLLVLTMALFFALFFTGEALAQDDFSFLDTMTLSQLTALNEEISRRISEAEKDQAEADPSDFGAWAIGTYVDEFENPTGDSYVYYKGLIQGTFSNSVAEKCNLYVGFLIDKEDFAIRLYEYTTNGLVKVSSKTVYDITILDDKNGKHTGQATQYSDRLFMPDGVLQLLLDNAKLSFYIEETGTYASSTYLFTIPDTSGFKNAYAALGV